MRTRRLRERRVDLAFIAFFLVNLLVITYIIDLEQLVIADTAHFNYPAWPPAPFIDAVHWYGRTFDPLLMARPPFWRMTIWIDVIYFGPFYAFALYAFIRGRNWIRLPALVWSGMMLSNVLIILMEERFGPTPPPNFLVVVGFNLLWLLMPVAMMLRMRRPEPFAARAPVAEPAVGRAAEAPA
jgi:emopamil binding protein